MKIIVLVSFLCVAGAGLVAGVASDGPLDQIHWELYKKSFGKAYNDTSEESLRRSLFLETKRKVEQHNAHYAADKIGFEMGYSQLSDWTSDELSQLNGLKMADEELPRGVGDEELPEFMKEIMEMDVEDLPKEVDWRKVANRVSEVKDQGNCGSCWAFATTGVLEGQEIKIDGEGQLISLSEQNLVECSNRNERCSGGQIVRALQDIADEHGIESEKDYPYDKRRFPIPGQCAFNSSKSLMNQVSGGRMLDASDDVLQKFVANFGPVAVGIEATVSLMNYNSGVFSDPTCDSKWINHGVLVVGYGTDAKQGNFWIVKNSWGVNWGEQGYFRLVRNGQNPCGIASMPVIPLFN